MNFNTLFSIVLCSFFFFACGEEKSTLANAKPSTSKSRQAGESEPKRDLIELENELLLGSWRGTSGGREIEVIMEAFDRAGGLVYGFTRVNGNKRIVEGWIEEEESLPQPCTEVLSLILEEPGDHPMDGIYSLKLVGHYRKGTGDQPCGTTFASFSGTGTWESLSGVPDEEVVLKK